MQQEMSYFEHPFFETLQQLDVSCCFDDVVLEYVLDSCPHCYEVLSKACTRMNQDGYA